MKIILTLTSLVFFILGLIGVIICKIRKGSTKKAWAAIGISVVIYIVVVFMPEQRVEKIESIITRLDNIEVSDN